METQQMAMPAEMAAQGPSPEETAIYDQMRQQISPQEFSNEMLAGASQVDPQAVAEFTQELQSLDVSAEELDTLNDLVDQVLANPEQYDQLRQQYLAQGMPDDILPEQFDPYFFAALNMAVDQMIAAPTGVQAFAQGGIAELKPIAKAIASYGRNGDTMLAHITPAEARMLRRRGGSGTINPATGLPEFFLKKAFKSIGKAVKKFAQSSIGRIVLPIALGFFLGPAAASFMGVGAGTAAGLAVSGFVGGAGSTLLAGGNLKDALKAGAIGGVIAGAGGVLSGAQLTGAATMTPGQAFQGQVDKFTGMFRPGAPVQASVPQTGGTAEGLGPNQAPTPNAGQGLDVSSRKVGINLDGTSNPTSSPTGALPPADAAYDLNMQAQQAARTASTFDPKNALTDNVTTGAQRDAYMASQGLDKAPSLVDQAKDFYSRNTPSGIKEAATPGAQQAGAKAVAEYKAQMAPLGVTPTSAELTNVYNKAFKAAMPGVLGTYGPTLAAGTGIMALAGGFESKPTQGGPITQSLMKPVTQRIREAGTQRQMYMQGLPGVVYDEFGAPVFGQSTRLPTYDVPDYDAGGFRSFGSSSQPGMTLPPVYTSPSGSFGSRQVAQPYNTASMYTNLMPPQGYADGGQVQYFDNGGPASSDNPPSPNDNKPAVKTPEQLAAERQAALETMMAQQKAGRDIANQRRAERRAAGSGQMYNNINAGLAALAPENFPGAPVTVSDERRRAILGSFEQGKATSDIDYARIMQQQGYRPEEMAAISGRSYGDINRRYQTALRQDAYAPMLQGQRTAMDQQAGIAASGQLPRDISGYSGQDKAGLYRGLARQGLTDAQIRAGAENRYGMQTDADWKGLQDTVANPNLNTDRPVAQQPAGEMRDMEYRPGRDYDPVTFKPMTPPPGSTGGMYSNITNPQAGYTGPNLYAQTLAMGMPSRDAMLPAYQYTPLAPGATRQPAPAIPIGSGTGDMERKQQQYQALLGQGATDAQIRFAGETMFGPQTSADMTALRGGSTRFMNMGGIAGLAQGGYPRRTGQISGPGTEKSDSIPAMLSDGEFVMTAKAVRGAGKGSRRAGAKQMYKLMHQLEKNSERG